MKIPDRKKNLPNIREVSSHLQLLSFRSKICLYRVFVLNFADDIRYFLTNLWQHIFNGEKFTNLFQVSLSWHILDAVSSFFLNKNTTGRIPSRTARNYEGIRNTPLTKLDLLSSVFLIPGTEIKDAAKNYTECY